MPASCFEAQKATAQTWSGVVILPRQPIIGQPSCWSYVGASWTVPAVTAEASNPSRAWAWVGIDGWDPSEGDYVVQGGTQSNVTAGNTGPLSTYHAWHEYYNAPVNNPDPNNQAQIFTELEQYMGPSVPISASVAFDSIMLDGTINHFPADPRHPTSVTVTVLTWPGNDFENDASYTYQLGNFTPQLQYVEGIMERPGVGNPGPPQLYDLANYNTFSMSSVEAISWDISDGGWQPFYQNFNQDTAAGQHG